MHEAYRETAATLFIRAAALPFLLVGGVLASCAPNVVGMQPFAVAQRPADRTRPWILSEASSKPLIYIATNTSRLVYVYTLKQHLVGQLDVGSPQGECVDSAGNVWITDTPFSRLVEYAHGAAKPTRSLNDPGQQPVGCSVSKATGDLAVANICSAGGCGDGNIAVFTKARGKPRSYLDPTIDHYYACAYDEHGDLLVAGKPDKKKPSQHEVHFSMLSAASGKMRSVTMPKNLMALQNIQWTHGYFAVEGFPNDKSVIYHISVTGLGDIKVLGQTSLESNPIDFFIMGKQMLSLSIDGILSFLHYPSGALIRSSPLDWFVKEPDFLVVSNPP